jgi:hypothetical protein
MGFNHLVELATLTSETVNHKQAEMNPKKCQPMPA